MPRFLLCAFALLALGLQAQVKTDDMRILALDYELRVLDDTQTIDVVMKLRELDRPQLRVAMPEWTPGSYSIQGYGNWVSDFHARSGDRDLDFVRIDRGTWSIATEGASEVEISYRITARQRRFTNFKPDPEKRYSGMHIQGPNTFLYVVGNEQGTPVSCRYFLPEGWQVANGMNLTDDPFLRRARDYDTLIDCPTILGKFERRTFVAEGADFSCVFWNPADSYDWDLDAFTTIVEKIVRNQASIFGGLPFRRYVFLFTVSPFGGGGLEHLTSTSIGLSDGAMKNNVKNGASIVAHEFFHTWNVKRIRPESLGPFRYDQENYTGNLWVAEGWTSYYGDLSLMRTEILSRENYLRQTASGIAREFSKPRRKEHSVTWASSHVWHKDQDANAGARVDYYSRGELLGLLIDLKMRDVTDGRKSLDDVMSFMNRWFAERNRGYAEDDVERACTAVSNHDFSEFFARYVNGQMDPPWAEFFAPFGLNYRERRLATAFPFSTREAEGGLAVRFLRQQGRQAGLERGDLIVAIDGTMVSDEEAWLEGKEPGRKVKLTVKRKDEAETKEIEIELLDLPRNLVTLDRMPELDERQSRLLEGWCSGR